MKYQVTFRVLAYDGARELGPYRNLETYALVVSGDEIDVEANTAVEALQEAYSKAVEEERKQESETTKRRDIRRRLRGE